MPIWCMGKRPASIWISGKIIVAAAKIRARAMRSTASLPPAALRSILRRSCEHVEAIDSSEHAIKSAEANRDLNGIRNVTFREADVFDVLTGYAGARRKFDTVVLDPPASRSPDSRSKEQRAATKRSTSARCGCSIPAEYW